MLTAEFDECKAAGCVLGEQTAADCMSVFRPLRVVLQRVQNTVLRLLPIPLVVDPFEIETQFLLFGPRIGYIWEEKLLLELGAFLPLFPGLGDGVLDLLLYFEQEARFPSELHLVEHDIYELPQHPWL